MRLVAAAFGARGSLQRRLVANLVVALIVCMAGAAILLTEEFFEHLEERAEDALRIEAEELAAQLDPGLPDLGQDPTALRILWRRRRLSLHGLRRRMAAPARGRTRARASRRRCSAWRRPRARCSRSVRIGWGWSPAVICPRSGTSFSPRARLYSADRTDFMLLRHELDEAAQWLLVAVILVLTAAIVTARRCSRRGRCARRWSRRARSSPARRSGG